MEELGIAFGGVLLTVVAAFTVILGMNAMAQKSVGIAADRSARVRFYQESWFGSAALWMSIFILLTSSIGVPLSFDVAGGGINWKQIYGELKWLVTISALAATLIASSVRLFQPKAVRRDE